MKRQPGCVFLLIYSFHNIAKLLLLFTASWLCLPLMAQRVLSTSVNMQSLTVEDGLSQSTVYDIAQDSKGFMWFATFNGLDRYDGNGFIHFQHDEQDTFSISSNQVDRLLVDSKGRLWAGTWSSGLNFFDAPRRRWYHFLPGKSILDLREGDANDLYICDKTTVTRLSIMPRSSCKEGEVPFRIESVSAKIPVPVPMPSAVNGQLFSDNRKRIYLVTRTALYAVRFNAGTHAIRFTLLRTCPGNWGMPVFSQDANTGKYYFSTADGIWESRDVRSWTKIHEAVLPYFSTVYIDGRSRLWYNRGGRVDTLNLLTGKEGLFTHLRNPGGSMHAQMIPVMQDRNNTLWLRTPVNGLVTYNDDENYFHTLLRDVFVGSLFRMNSNHCLVNDKWVLHFTEKGIIKSKREPGETNFFQNAFAIWANDGDGWYVSDTVLFHYRAATGRHIGHPIPYRRFGLPLEHVPPRSGAGTHKIAFGISCLTSIIDKDGCVWLTCARGFAYYDTREDSFHFVDRGRNAGYFYQDGAGVVWMYANDGIYTYDKRTGSTGFFPRYNSEGKTNLPPAKSNPVFCDDPIDAQHTLWIGTHNGLYRMNKKTGRCRLFNGQDGLPANLIYSLLRDEKRGNLWMSTGKGLSCLDAATFSVRNFSQADGLQGSEFNARAALQLPNGTMLFGGTQGLSCFQPAQIVSMAPPATIVTGCNLFGEPIEKGATGASVVDIAYTSDVSIRYCDNIISFTFSGIDYRKKNGLQYRYKMVPFDKDWHYAGATHEAVYTNLHPGDYSFVAQASNSSGIWGDESRPVRLHVLPLWWQTWWTHTAAAAALISLSFLLYRYRLRQVVKVERIRNGIARDLHDEIGSTLSTIAIYSAIANQYRNKPEADPYPLMKKINENADKAMEAMNDIVWSINTNNDRFENILQRMQEHAVQLLEVKGYAVHFFIDERLEQKIFGLEKRKNFYLIYKETLNNIAKYADGRNVWVQICEKKPLLVLIVKDDGKGFQVGCTSGGGNGHFNMRSRAASMGGTVTITSEVDWGTEIRLEVPCR